MLCFYWKRMLLAKHSLHFSQDLVIKSLQTYCKYEMCAHQIKGSNFCFAVKLHGNIFDHHQVHYPKKSGPFLYH